MYENVAVLHNKDEMSDTGRQTNLLKYLLNKIKFRLTEALCTSIDDFTLTSEAILLL